MDNPMVAIYVQLVKNGLRTVEQIPNTTDNLKECVINKLKEDGFII
jgi:hypothetical protein